MTWFDRSSAVCDDHRNMRLDLQEVSKCVKSLASNLSTRSVEPDIFQSTLHHLFECLMCIQAVNDLPDTSSTDDSLPFSKQEQLVLSLAGQLISQLYVDHANNPKLFQKLRKITEKLMVLQPETEKCVQEEIEKLFSGPTHRNLSADNLAKVSSLLDSSKIAKRILGKNFHGLLSTLAKTLITEITRNDDARDDGIIQPCQIPAKDLCYQAAKVFLQMCQHGLKELQLLLWQPSDTSKTQMDSTVENLHHIISGLLTLLQDQPFSKDSGLMAGSSLAMMLNSAPIPKQAATVLKCLLSRYSGKQIDQISMNLKIGNITICKEPLNQATPSSVVFSQLAIVRGILTCCDKAILLEDTHVSTSDKVRILAVDVLFQVVCSLCKRADGELKYHAIEALFLYLQAMKRLIPLMPKDTLRSPLFGKDSEQTQTILQVVWQEWQSPVDGVTEMTRSALSALLDLHCLESRMQGVESSELVDSITSSLLDTAWHVKGRYHLMTALMSHHSSVIQLLRTWPDLPGDMLKCLGTNYLAAASTELYNAIVRRMRWEVGGAGRGGRKGEEEEVLADRWADVWGEILLQGLCNQDCLLRYHSSKYWLPSTIKSFPGSFELLIKELDQKDSQLQLHSDKDHSVRNLHAHIVVLKYARTNGYLDSNWLSSYREIVLAGLWHSEDSIQEDSLSLLCCSPKKSELPTDSEICVLRETFPHFLNSDSAAFRNQLRHNMSMFVGRLCDNSLWRLKCLKKLETKLVKSHSDKQQEKIVHTLGGAGETVQRATVLGNSLLSCKSTTHASLEEQLLRAVDCLDWIAEVCFGSLFPGACYQRKRAVMDVLGVIYECLLSRGKRQNTKESSLNVMTWAAEHGKCNLLSERNAMLLLECIQDGASDIRSSSYDLLSTYFPASLPSSTAFPYSSSSQILCLALQLVSSPRLQESEAGGLLTKMVFYKQSVPKSLRKTDENPTTPTRLPSTSDRPLPEKAPVQFVTSLLSSLTHQLKCCKTNLLQAASATPMHGLIRAIRRCLTDHPSKLLEIIQADSASWSSLVEELLVTLKDITSFILLILAGQEDIGQTSEADSPKIHRPEMAPSFGQMGEAIERLILDSAACRTDAAEDETDLTASLSEEHQLILACCWLNLKECSLLLGSLVETLPLCSENEILTLEQVTAMADILFDILTRCRHKGAIEGCNHGFSKLCSRLLVSHDPKLQAIPKTLLDRVLRLVTDQGAGSSFTKMSAGLPLLVESIISAEPRGRERLLLSYTMTNLMSIASQPLPSNPNERLDLPQSHALNIMRALFCCSAVGSDILKYCSSAVRMAVGGFSSPSWIIRNCCMRLFGTLIARIFGQKKVHDEHSQINAMSAATFFSRYPELKQLLLEEVTFSESWDRKQAEAQDGTRRKEVLSEEKRENLSGGKVNPDSVAELPGRLQEDETDSKLEENHSKTGRLLLRPSLHPVLTLLSKLGPGVGNEDVESLSEFRQPVRQLASSAIYAVRELAARALVPLVPEAEIAKQIAEIIKELPPEAALASNFNRLHGNLLQVEKLLEKAIQNISMQSEDLFFIQTELQSKIWIAGATNPCALVRALFVRVTLAVITEAYRTCGFSVATELALEMQAVVKEYLRSSPPFQIGIACLNKVMATAELDLIKMTSDPLNSGLLTSAHDLLTSKDSDVKLGALDFLQSHLKEVVSCSNLQVLQRLTDKLMCLIVHPDLEKRCLERALTLWVDFSNRTESKSSLVSDWPHVWEVVTGLVEGRRRSGLIAAALPVVGRLLQCNLGTSMARTTDDQWSCWMVKYSDSLHSETIRLAVVGSMKIAAPTVLAHLATHQMEDKIDVAIDLLNVLLHLLQDEDQDIRLEASAIVSLQLPRGDKSPQCRHLHSNAAQQVLVDYMCRTFSWSRKFMSSIISLLHGSVDVSEFIQGSWTSGTHLFQQESANMYAEGVMEARVIYQALLDTLDRERTSGSGRFKDWLRSWYGGALCLQTSQEELEKSQKILETGVPNGGPFHGLSSQSMFYQAIYRQLLSTKFLCMAAKQLKMDEETVQAMNGLQQILQKILEMPSVHPCLKTELSAFLQFLAS